MKKIISKSILLSIGVILVNFGFKIYLSYRLPKEQIGIFYTQLDMVTAAALFFSGYKDSLIRIVTEERFSRIGKRIVRTYALTTLLLLPILYLVYVKSGTALFRPEFFLLFFIATQISNYYSYLNAAYRNYDSMLYEKSVKAVTLVAAFALYSGFFEAVTALILAYVTQPVVHTLYIYKTSPRLFFLRCGAEAGPLYRAFLKNCTLATLTTFLGSATVTLSGIVMLWLYDDGGILSEYQVVAKSVFFALIVVFVHPLAAYTFPEISKWIASGKFWEIRRFDGILKKYLLLFMMLLLGATFLTPYAVAALFPPEYLHAYVLLNTLIPLLPFIVYTSFAINVLKGFDRFDLALYVRAWGSAVFFFCIVLLYRAGVDAMSVVYSLDVSFFAMFLLAWYYKRRVLA